jgi:F-type H+-transporting ATPase subunit a
MNLDISVHAEKIFQIGGFPVTNSLLLSIIVFLFLTIIAIIVRKKLSLIPNYLQNIAEIIIDGALNLMNSIFQDRHKSEKYLPLILTIFLFVLFSNWIGLLPGVGSINILNGEGKYVPIFRSPASDLNFTLALALITVTLVNILGMISIGVFSRVKIFFNFKSPIKFFVGILEFISEVAKIVSFSFRLFGNVLAGEVLLIIMVFLIPYIPPFPFLFLETFTSFFQAFVFAMLALIFVSIAVTSEEEFEDTEYMVKKV